MCITIQVAKLQKKNDIYKYISLFTDFSLFYYTIKRDFDSHTHLKAVRILIGRLILLLQTKDED